MAFPWILAALFSAPALAVAPYDLRDSAIYAINHSPTLDLSERNLIIAGLNRKNTESAFLPTLDLTSSHGLQRNSPQVDPYEPYFGTYSFNLNEILYDNGEMINKHNAAVTTEQASRLVTERDRAFDISFHGDSPC